MSPSEEDVTLLTFGVYGKEVINLWVKLESIGYVLALIVFRKINLYEA